MQHFWIIFVSFNLFFIPMKNVPEHVKLLWESYRIVDVIRKKNYFPGFHRDRVSHQGLFPFSASRGAGNKHFTHNMVCYFYTECKAVLLLCSIEAPRLIWIWSFQLKADHPDLKFIRGIFHFSPQDVIETDEYAAWVNRYSQSNTWNPWLKVTKP